MRWHSHKMPVLRRLRSGSLPVRCSGHRRQREPARLGARPRRPHRCRAPADGSRPQRTPAGGGQAHLHTSHRRTLPGHRIRPRLSLPKFSRESSLPSGHLVSSMGDPPLPDEQIALIEDGHAKPTRVGERWHPRQRARITIAGGMLVAGCSEPATAPNLNTTGGRSVVLTTQPMIAPTTMALPSTEETLHSVGTTSRPRPKRRRPQRPRHP